MVQYGTSIAPPYRANPSYGRYYPGQYPFMAQQPYNRFINTPEFGKDFYQRNRPPQNLLEFWQTQNPELTLPALMAFAQQYAAQQKQADQGIAMTPQKGAKIGAVALAALGFIVHSWQGLLSGGVVGAIAGWIISKSLLEKENKHHR